MIRVTKEARRILGTLRLPDGEVLRLVRSPEGLVFQRGSGEDGDQVVWHGGKRVMSIAPSVREGFDGHTVDAVDGALGVVPPSSLPANDGS